MRLARPVTLDPEQWQLLEQQARPRSLPARVVERARIVLRAATGQQDQQIAAELGITPEKSARWRNRFLDRGWAALQKDAPRPGRLCFSQTPYAVEPAPAETDRGAKARGK